MPPRHIIPAGAAVPFLVAMMLLSGVTNTLLTKYQDQVCLSNCDDPDPTRRKHFEQPVIQTAQMFIGEMGCWLVVAAIALYHRVASNSKSPSHRDYEPVPVNDNLDADPEDRSLLHSTAEIPHVSAPDPRSSFLSGWRVCIIAFPAICDILGTTMMNGGLLLVAASIYQMTRGALVLFVGAFSVLFLGRHLHLFQWISLAGVVLGVAIVGLAGALYPDSEDEFPQTLPIASPTGASNAVRVIVGVLLIAFAQVFTASQFVLEEWIFEKSDIQPLNAVGWEGIFGFLVTFITMLLLHVFVGRTQAGKGGYFDVAQGWNQMVHNPPILVSSLLIMVSIGCFNFFGLSVTRSVSATSRSTIDTCRTLFIWIISLGLGWESFKWLQVAGFILLVYFTFLYNGLVEPPLSCLRVRQVEQLLPEEPIEHN